MDIVLRLGYRRGDVFRAESLVFGLYIPFLGCLLFVHVHVSASSRSRDVPGTRQRIDEAATSRPNSRPMLLVSMHTFPPLMHRTNAIRKNQTVPPGPSFEVA